MNFKKKQLNFLIIQHRIVQATQKQQQRKIRNLQRLLIKSLSTRIQTIFIVSKKKNFLIKQTKDLSSLDFYFIKKFILIFSKKIKKFFVIAKKLFKESKRRNQIDLFSSLSDEEKTNYKKKQTLNKFQTMFLFFLQSFFAKENLRKTKNSLLLLLWKFAFFPVVETLLKEKEEKNFRNPSEIILFLNNFCFKSKNFFERKKKVVDKQEIICPWILKFEIQGFDKYLNNSWLYKNIPIELFILKKIFSQKKKIFNTEEIGERVSPLISSFRKTPFFFFYKKQKGQGSFKKQKLSKECFSYKKSQKNSLFHKDFFTKWKNLSSENSFFNNFHNTNFDNFFNFCLIGLEIFLKEIFCILDEFYFSEFFFLKKLKKNINPLPFLKEREKHKEVKKTKEIFYYPQSIYLIGLNRRQFQRITKLINLFLKKRGLDLKHITYFNLKKGFDFLGWTLKITKKSYLMVKISDNFQHLQKKEIKWLIKNTRSQSLYKLIIKLNNKIEKDLIEYENQRLCSIVENIEIFYSDLNFFINKIFWKWAKKRHNSRSNVWIFQKYWDLRNKRSFLISKKRYYLQSKQEGGHSLSQVFKEHKKRVFVLLYQKYHFLNFQKNQKYYLNSKFFLFKKRQKNFYFLGNEVPKRSLNFYSLDFQTQYYFFIFLEQ